MKRVVVTGGAGFFGSHMAETLAKQAFIIRYPYIFRRFTKTWNISQETFLEAKELRRRYSLCPCMPSLQRCR